MTNMKKISKIITAGAGAATLGLVYTQNAFAAGNGLTNVQSGVTTTETAAGGLSMQIVISTVIGTMLFVVGLLAVVMLIYGGIRYVTSHGDKAQVTAAKETIMYAVVGLVVAIAAFAVVQWITNDVFKGGASSGSSSSESSSSTDGKGGKKTTPSDPDTPSPTKSV